MAGPLQSRQFSLSPCYTACVSCRSRSFDRTVIAAEVKTHCEAGNCWIVIEGHAYDCTAWVAKHPGGERSILRFGGKDCTKIFNKIHSKSAHAMLPAMCVGVVATAASQPPPPLATDTAPPYFCNAAAVGSVLCVVGAGLAALVAGG